MPQGCPPPPGPVCASTVHGATPGEVAIASKVNIKYSPGSNAVPPPLAVRLIALDCSAELQDADGASIVIGSMTVNPVGMATFADPRVLLMPVFVMVTVYVTRWLAVADVGDMVAVKALVFACTFMNAQEGISISEISMLATTALHIFLRSIGICP